MIGGYLRGRGDSGRARAALWMIVIVGLSVGRPLPALSDEGDKPAAKTGVAKTEDADDGWNAMNNEYLTVHLGAGFLVDWTSYSQDAESGEQMPLDADEELRDLRFWIDGRFKFLPRVGYVFGYMYDAPDDSWRVRRTLLSVKIPELGGDLVIGRDKEFISMTKIMVGYYGWAIERSAVNDAFMPILADGVKWMGAGFGGKLLYNVGGFVDWRTKHQPFNKNDWQTVGRVVWLPFAGSESRTVLHLALAARHGDANDGTLSFRSKPESFSAQSNAVDTGMFPADSHTILGAEAYFQYGVLTLGIEYFLNKVWSAETGDPFFHGGEAFAAILLGGERPYANRIGIFRPVLPTRSMWNGGLGAVELVLRQSYVDLDSGAIEGGTFRRISPSLNWYLTKDLRLVVGYGYGHLDRLGLEGDLHFFQTRLQILLD